MIKKCYQAHREVLPEAEVEFLALETEANERDKKDFACCSSREEFMPKLRRGRGGARGDLWTLAGGEDRVLQSFIAIGILPNPISSSSEVWSRLASVVFGQDSSNNRKWLYTTWTLNRKGIKTRVEATLQRQSEQATGQILSASQEQHVEQDHQVNKKDGKETQTGTVSDQVKEESELELLNDDDRNDDIAKQGTESEDDSVDEQMYKNDDRETETDTNSESEDDADTEQVENDERKTYIGTESEEDNYSEVVQGEIKSEKITQTGTDSEEEDDSDIETFVDINDDREIQTGTESEESDSDVEQVEKKTVKVKQRGMESEEDEDSEVEQGKG
ncbi:hypothetical protein NQZ68_014180 [Dissostichus eleginoides]|nr:hypothetical protein NQZ68_014180 [Dissostichus eleginoides]